MHLKTSDDQLSLLWIQLAIMIPDLGTIIFFFILLSIMKCISVHLYLFAENFIDLAAVFY